MTYKGIEYMLVFRHSDGGSVWRPKTDAPQIVNYIVDDIQIAEPPLEFNNNEVSVLSEGAPPAVLKLPKNRVAIA